MASARDIQSRIKSVQDTMKITNAMYLISSTKVKKARRALTEALPHFEQSEELIAEILRDLPELEDRYFGTGEPILGGKKGYLVISGDKGLAGAYNHNILKFAEGVLQKETDPAVCVVGRLGALALQKLGYAVDRSFIGMAQQPSVERARRIAAMMCQRFMSGELSEVYVIFRLHLHPHGGARRGGHPPAAEAAAPFGGGFPARRGQAPKAAAGELPAECWGGAGFHCPQLCDGLPVRGAGGGLLQ